MTNWNSLNPGCECCEGGGCCMGDLPLVVYGHLSFSGGTNEDGQSWPASIGPFRLTNPEQDPCGQRYHACEGTACYDEAPEGLDEDMRLLQCADPEDDVETIDWGVTRVGISCNEELADRGCGPCDRYIAAMQVTDIVRRFGLGSLFRELRCEWSSTWDPDPVRSEECCSLSPLLLVFKFTYVPKGDVGNPSEIGNCCVPEVEITLTITDEP